MTLYILYSSAFLLAIALIIWQGWRMSIGKKYRSQADQILNGPPQPEKRYSESQLEGLPTPVRLYFKTVLREGQLYPKTVKVIHDGQFRTHLKSKWITITGCEHFSARRPAFIWRGSTFWFTATDSFLSDKGSLVVRLFGLFKVAERNSKKIDYSELQRWLCECVWFPTFLLPNENLGWLSVDEESAQLEFHWKEHTVFATVKFGPDHTISEISTKRYDSKDCLRLWIGKMSRYQLHGGMLIPSRIEAAWESLAEGSYARFHLKEINYDPS